jgi:T-complex protein 1 subunit gamma
LKRMQAVADIIRSTLGPRSMLKMLLDPNGGVPRETRQRSACGRAAGTRSEKRCAIAGIVLTNDGNAILREIDVSHPAAKVRGSIGLAL